VSEAATSAAETEASIGMTVAYRNLTDGQLEQGEAHVAVHVADGHVECVLRHLISREGRRNVTGLKSRHIAVSIAFTYVSKTT